jgi:4-aminobutyrate aminotransferase
LNGDPPPASEGDDNLSSARSEWTSRHLDATTRALLAEDESWFLRQSLSTPCLNVAVGADGSHLTDAQGRQILDFHGNSVHQVATATPR